jgi:hypothetical protein
MDMNPRTFTAILLSVLLLAGCESDVGDLNNPQLGDLQGNPTAAAAASVATGLLVGTRKYIAPRNGYVSLLGVLGRESYDLDNGDPRFVTELLFAKNLDAGTPAIGGNLWTQPYANIRNANLLLAALPKVAVLTLSDADKEATRGFAKTIQALDFLQVINTRDTNGAPIQVDLPVGQLAPIVSKAEVFARIAQLLDEAQTHLGAAGAKFPFPLSRGFTGFDTPATFLKFNRALKARVEVYQGNFASALTALQGSFLDDGPASDLKLGVYHSFSTASGDITNGLDDSLIYAHPSIKTDAEEKSPGVLDDRYTSKIKTVTPKTLQGVTSDLAFTIYDKPDIPVPIIRNEELILLRAEANIPSNIGAAITDINYIRRRSGGLQDNTGLNAGNILDELLKQKRYSLLFEGGHRWIDMRRYGKLSALQEPGTVVHSAFPIPLAEQDARR